MVIIFCAFPISFLCNCNQLPLKAPEEGENRKQLLALAAVEGKKEDTLLWMGLSWPVPCDTFFRAALKRTNIRWRYARAVLSRSPSITQLRRAGGAALSEL